MDRRKLDRKREGRDKDNYSMAFLPALRLASSRIPYGFSSFTGGLSGRLVHSSLVSQTWNQNRGLSDLATSPAASRKPVMNLVAQDGVERQATLNGPSFKLAPSDFAFLWKECKRCFYLKSHGLLYRPRTPFPSIFNRIDGGMKDFFMAKRTESVLPSMPPGEFLCEEEDAWVESELIDVGRKSTIFIKGKIDCLVLNDDQTYSIIDFKTSDITRYLEMYARQLHAYALALEYPSGKSEIVKGKVTHMGLVVYRPDKFGFSKAAELATDGKKSSNAVANLEGECQYVPIQRNQREFFQFLGEVVDTLEGEIPKPSPDCPCCRYLREATLGEYHKP